MRGQKVIVGGSEYPDSIEEYINKAVFLGGLSWHYGTFLLEGMARMSAVVKGEQLNDMHFIFHNMLNEKSLQPFHNFFFEQLGILDRVVVPKHTMRCFQLYIPESSIHLHKLWSRDSLTVYSKLSKNIKTTNIDRVYLFRRRMRKRSLRNETECENVFRDFGFEIIHPELLGIEEQISIFKSAKLVAGPIGSALHNIVFSPKDTKLIALYGGAINSNFLGVDFLRGAPTRYIEGPIEEGQEFTINISELRTQLGFFL